MIEKKNLPISSLVELSHLFIKESFPKLREPIIKGLVYIRTSHLCNGTCQYIGNTSEMGMLYHDGKHFISINPKGIETFRFWTGNHMLTFVRSPIPWGEQLFEVTYNYPENNYNSILKHWFEEQVAINA